MKMFNINNVLICISKEDLIEYGFLKSDNLALIRLTSSELSKIISKVININNEDIEIIDFSYYGVTNNQINYEVKFFIEENK